MSHRIEPAPSARAKCRGCGERIAAGELRFGESLPNPLADGEMTLWFHLDCARAPIDRGAWRIALVFYEEGRFEPSGFVHAGCAQATFETTDILPRVRRFSPGLREQDLAEIQADLGRPVAPEA